MELVSEIVHTYASFFDLSMWKEVLLNPVSWGFIATLILLEGILSADNAIVLAVMVKGLPKEEQKKALTYGLFGAYFFRFLFIGLGVFLIKLWWIKLLGAAYLLYLTINHFLKKKEEEQPIKKFNIPFIGAFWTTVICVELMDIAFSIDSILAAFAVSNSIWILLLGGMIGILMMRTIAKGLITLIEKIPELEQMAYILIGIMGVKMLMSVIGFELKPIIFFTLMLSIIGFTIVKHLLKSQEVQKS